MGRYVYVPIVGIFSGRPGDCAKENYAERIEGIHGTGKFFARFVIVNDGALKKDQWRHALPGPKPKN